MALEAAGLAKGSGVPNKNKVGKVTKDDLKQIVETKKAGHDVVVAVSAMGDKTDELIELCKELKPFGGFYATHMRD